MTRPNRNKTLCKGKKRYAAVELATSDALRLFVFPTTRRVRIYPCPICGCFHVTRGAGHNWVWQAEREDEPATVDGILYRPAEH